MSAIELNQEVELEDSEVNQAGRLSRIVSTLKEFATFAEVMRFIGAGIIVSAMTLLLLKGWSEGNDISRYIKLLSMTGLLGVAGLLLSYVMGEQKGARVFYHLAHLSVPVNFGILGALLYSVFPDSHLLQNYPAFTVWKVVDGGTLALTALAALTVLVPVSLLGFKLLHRERALELSAWFLVLNSLLLLPFRTPVLVSLIFMLAVAGATLGYLRLISSDSGRPSVANRFGALMLFVPAVQILIRNLYLYQLDELMGLVIFAGIYASLRFAAHKNSGSLLVSRTLDFVSLPLAIGTAVCATGLVSMADSMIVNSVFAGVMATFMLDTKSRFSDVGLVKSINLGIAALLIGSMVIVSTLDHATLLETGFNIMVSVSLIAFGLWCKERPVMILGVLVFLFATWAGLQDFIDTLLQGNWVVLAITGGLVILSASLVERYGALLKLKYVSRMSRQSDSV